MTVWDGIDYTYERPGMPWWSRWYDLSGWTSCLWRPRRRLTVTTIVVVP